MRETKNASGNPKLAKVPRGNATTEYIWNQLKGLLMEDVVRALRADGFSEDSHYGSQRIYIKRLNGKSIRTTIENYSTADQKCPRDQLGQIMNDVGWKDEDLQRLFGVEI